MAKPIRALELRYPMIQFLIIDLIHVTRHLCTRFRIAMSRDISGGKQVIKFANTSNRGRVCLFSLTASKKVTMMISTQNLPLSSLR